MKIARQFHFEAAHRLVHHDGSCQRLHGHSYRLELVFTGDPRPIDPLDPQSGFAADFGRLDRLVRENLLKPHLDHYDLTDHLAGLHYPSAEHVAVWIMAWCQANLDHHPEMGQTRIHTVRLWETAQSWAEADRDDPTRLGIGPP